jgi:hypothetical protein
MENGRNWGGKRAGAGRKRNGWKVVPHRKRPGTKAFPIRIALALAEGIGAGPLVQEALRREVRKWERDYRDREEIGEGEICEITRVSVNVRRIAFSLGAYAEECAREVHRFAVRLARRINKLLGRRGRVFRERYRVLSKPYVFVPRPKDPWDVRLKQNLKVRLEEAGIIAKWTLTAGFMGMTNMAMRRRPT